MKFPEECEHNGEIIYELLGRVPYERVPELSQLSEEEKKLMGSVVAYIIRPDLIKGGYALIGPNPLGPPDEYPKKLISQKEATLRNDPGDMKRRSWKLPEEYCTIGGELFRCLCAATSYIPSVSSKFKGLPFNLADAIAYLLDPEDLTDYLYTKKDIDKFDRTLKREIAEV
jgi:hypothetical protein